MSSKRRVFSREFKEEAVRLVRSGDRGLKEAAKSLKVDVSVLSRWLSSAEREGADAFRGQGKRTVAEQELSELRLKNKQLEQELEFLKKVSRYFAKDPK